MLWKLTVGGWGPDTQALICLNLGAAGTAGFFKNVIHQFEDTVWFFPFINDWERDKLEFDCESFLYRKTVELARYFVNESKGSYFVSMADLSGNADSLAHMRGSENLLMDMLTDPDKVHDALDIVYKAWEKVTTEVYEIVRHNNDGGTCIGWLDSWGSGRHDQLQCDLSVMISPQLFDEFIYNELKAQSKIMDSCVYHFDGFEQTRHLDKILLIDTISVIQWTCVSGQPSPLEFIPFLKKIQSSGKGLLMYVTPGEIEPIMEQLSSKGLYLLVRPSSQEEGINILKKVEKLTHE